MDDATVVYVGGKWQGNAQGLTRSKDSPVGDCVHAASFIVGHVHSVAACDKSGHLAALFPITSDMWDYWKVRLRWDSPHKSDPSVV